MDLIWFILSSTGLTTLLVYATIFDPIRPSKEWLNGWGHLFHCPLCLGFWAGIFMFAVNPWTELFTFDYTVTNSLICGCVSSLNAYAFNVMLGDEGLNMVLKGGDHDNFNSNS